ncbi:MAG: Ribitol 2-dehydrogenase [Planctomycetota bacterium]|jgi:NAD(P)-dependent dehydrogenase (short-subunit alcohol dehydrogenase family)
MTRWHRKVVVVTGGSAGLGLQIVEAFLDAGATVVAVGRDSARLSSLAANCGKRGGGGLEASALGERLTGIVADVTCQADVERLFAEVGSRFGRLDALVNNVGRSTRGWAVDTTPEEFQQLWELNFLAAVRCARAAYPWLRRDGGHLVNIGSLAAKSAARFLGGYPATKAALAAYTQQLRLEWAEQRIHVMLVCPGPLRREDAGARYDAAAAGLPAEARRPGGGVRLKGLDPTWLARRIVRGCDRREAEIVAPAKARLLFALQQLAPSWGDWLVGRMTRGG